MISRLPDVSAEKILIVDDDKGTVELLKALLEKQGKIDTASNGKDAFGKLASRYFSAIVTDVDMPVMNGLELYAMAAARFPAIRAGAFSSSPPQRTPSASASSGGTT